jgi:serine/threonine protein phosphatase 1
VADFSPPRVDQEPLVTALRYFFPLFGWCEILLKTISEVRRCVLLASNASGRDLVVGDLHGHRSLFEQELERLGFDPSRDRVFSVGDLINRGPQSLATLHLITEPWFHAVLGNHELMLLNFLGCYGSRVHSRKSFATAGGDWIIEAIAKNRKAIARLADEVASLPLAIHVDSGVPFNVTHADLHPVGSKQANLFSHETLCVNKADIVTTSRANISGAMKSALLELQFGRHSVQVSVAPLGPLPITYVGHSPLREVTVHNSYVYIDQGIGVRKSRHAAPTPPTVLDHRRFAYWLGGVATARSAVVPGAVRSSRKSGARAGSMPRCFPRRLDPIPARV